MEGFTRNHVYYILKAYFKYHFMESHKKKIVEFNLENFNPISSYLQALGKTSVV